MGQIPPAKEETPKAESQMPQPREDAKILGTFGGLVSLLGAALFFAGWIYRWAYFGFYELEITTLDLPFQSFLMVPIQIFLGSLEGFCRAIVTFLIIVIIIRCTSWAIQLLIRRLTWRRVRRQISFGKTLINETIVVAWILVALFQLARIQGLSDARRDANDRTSTLPVITLVTPDNRALGRKPSNRTENPQSSEFRVIGDIERYEELVGREINTFNDDRTWRLLIAYDGSLYIFRTLPPDASYNQRPLVLVLQNSSDENLLILSPEAINSK